jgi:hypothetical protein
MSDEIENEDEDEYWLPTAEQFLLEDGLYRERPLMGDWSFPKRLMGGPDIQFDAYCIHCAKMSTFREKLTRGSGAGMTPIQDKSYLDDRIIFKQLFCQREEKHKYTYVIEVFRQSIQKIGQSPSIADIAHVQFNRYEAVLDKQYVRELKTAAGLFAHGIGIGSFTYLRRVFEKILSDERDATRAEGMTLEGFETKHLDEKVEMLKDRLPSTLLKYRSIYKVLSAGVHNLSEQECLGYFPVLQRIITLILDDHLEVRSKKLAQEQLDREFAAINSTLNKPKA